MNLNSRQRKLNQECYAQILKAFMSGPQTLLSIIDLTGLHFRTVTPLLKCWRKHNLIHVCQWNPDALNRFVVPVFQWGPGPDAPRRSPEELLAEKAKRAADARARKKRKREAAGIIFASIATTLAPPK